MLWDSTSYLSNARLNELGSECDNVSLFQILFHNWCIEGKIMAITTTTHVITGYLMTLILIYLCSTFKTHNNPFACEFLLFLFSKMHDCNKSGTKNKLKNTFKLLLKTIKLWWIFLLFLMRPSLPVSQSLLSHSWPGYLTQGTCTLSFQPLTIFLSQL